MAHGGRRPGVFKISMDVLLWKKEHRHTDGWKEKGDEVQRTKFCAADASLQHPREREMMSDGQWKRWGVSSSSITLSYPTHSVITRGTVTRRRMRQKMYTIMVEKKQEQKKPFVKIATSFVVQELQ